MNDENFMSYDEFYEKLKEYLQLYNAAVQVTCPQIILMKRDEIGEEIRESFCDTEDNLTRWTKSKPCTFVSPETNKRMEIMVGKDPETLYHFLAFCQEIHLTGKVNEDRKTYLAYLLSLPNDTFSV